MPTAMSKQPTPSLKLFRCAVADDEIVIRDYWSLLLPLMFDPVEVVTFSSGNEALAKICAQPFDLIVLDIGLRVGMTGLELIAAIRGTHGPNASTPILVHSGRDNSEVVQSAMRGGASGFLSKGLSDLNEIRGAIRTVTEGGVYMPPLPMQGFLNEITHDGRRTRDDVMNVVNKFPHRQRQVAALMYLGQTEGAIAQRLGLASRDSVRTHTRAIYRALGVYSRAQFMSLLGTHVIKAEHFNADL
jgi:DNA-binding NarL/FixJ family response regulator